MKFDPLNRNIVSQQVTGPIDHLPQQKDGRDRASVETVAVRV